MKRKTLIKICIMLVCWHTYKFIKLWRESDYKKRETFNKIKAQTETMKNYSGQE